MTEEEEQIPEWTRELVDAITSNIEWKAQASLDCQLSGAEETDWGVDLVELWPSVMEIQEAGPNDGEMVFGIVDSFDLLTAQKIFDEVDAVEFGFENDGRSKITIEGTFKERAVAVIFYFEPELSDDVEDEVDGDDPLLPPPTP